MSVKTNVDMMSAVPIGCGMEWFTDTPPDGWMLQNGAAISRTTYSELFALIGTTYGVGNGSTTFNLPNKMGRVGVGKDSGTFNTLGKKLGTEEVTLTVNQIPSHHHTYTKTNCSTSDDYDRTYSQRGVVGYTQPTANTGDTGGGQPHSNIQPTLVQNYIIKVK